MTNHPDWVIKRARELMVAKTDEPILKNVCLSGAYDRMVMTRALCDHIAHFEKPPVDRDVADAAVLMDAAYTIERTPEQWSVAFPGSFPRVVTKLREIIADRVAEAVAPQTAEEEALKIARDMVADQTAEEDALKMARDLVAEEAESLGRANVAYYYRSGSRDDDSCFRVLARVLRNHGGEKP